MTNEVTEDILMHYQYGTCLMWACLYSITNHLPSAPDQSAFDSYYTMLHSQFPATAPAKDNTTPNTLKDHRGKCASPSGTSLTKSPKLQSELME